MLANVPQKDALKLAVAEYDPIPRPDAFSRTTHHFPCVLAHWRREQHLDLTRPSTRVFQLTVDASADHPRIIKDQDIGGFQKFRQFAEGGVEAVAGSPVEHHHA